MITITTSLNNYHLFLLLTGIAFEKSTYDPNRSHSFYWAMRWLAKQVIGSTWMLWLNQVGGE